jgi:DNA-binding NarL/FixJ family response regulator
VILMDIALREGSGIAAARAIGNAACIVFVSGNSDQRTLAATGAAAFLSKPFTADSLVCVVRAACGGLDAN